MRKDRQKPGFGYKTQPCLNTVRGGSLGHCANNGKTKSLIQKVKLNMSFLHFTYIPVYSL